jgi:centromere/kinetochore protein ZW10
VKAVLENYSFTIQLHHSQLLSKIPQQSAIFYNNCMYLCNWIALNNDLENCGMEVVMHELTVQAQEFFDCQIAKQKIQLLEILKEFDPSQSLNNIQPEHFKPIRQCLRQLDLLKNVWQTILPSKMYNETMGNLLDVVCMDMIKKVTAMEDISTVLSNSLVDFIRTVDEKGQSLFTADCSALEVVNNWQKLLHLQFILDASLVDIQASWSGNQITKSFKADEVKRMIRALFQNTERRANCLQAIS